jgi:hypothetical protein
MELMQGKWKRAVNKIFFGTRVHFMCDIFSGHDIQRVIEFLVQLLIFQLLYSGDSVLPLGFLILSPRLNLL